MDTSADRVLHAMEDQRATTSSDQREGFLSRLLDWVYQKKLQDYSVSTAPQVR